LGSCLTTPQKTSDLADKSQAFAAEVGELLASTLGTDKQMASVQLNDRYAVRPVGDEPHQQKIPLYVGQEHVADLLLAIYLTLDRSGTYLKTARADFRVFSTLDRTPLLRMEYHAGMRVDPVCHWQVHAERGAFTHLLSMANAIDARRVRRPHDLSTIHLPVGGERFRPCLEDLIELLIQDCGVDHVPDWEAAVQEGRHRWRLRQFRSAVRDLQEEAADVLRLEGWTLVPPAELSPAYETPYRRW